MRENTGYCHSCKRQVLVRQETTNDVLYAILTIFSCGLWGIVWFFSSLTNRPWRCTACGMLATVGDYSGWIQQQQLRESRIYSEGLREPEKPPSIFELDGE